MGLPIVVLHVAHDPDEAPGYYSVKGQNKILRRAMLDRILPAVMTGNSVTFRQIADIDEEVDALHGHIVTYLTNIGQQSLTENQMTKLMSLISAVNDLENVGDIIETDIIHLGNERLASNLHISKETETVLTKLYDVISTMAELVIESVMVVDKQVLARSSR